MSLALDGRPVEIIGIEERPVKRRHARHVQVIERPVEVATRELPVHVRDVPSVPVEARAEELWRVFELVPQSNVRLPTE